MIGYIRYTREKGRTPASIEALCGLPVMTVTLHAPEGMRPGALERRLNSISKSLHKASVSRIILPPEFPYRERFFAFRPAEPLVFYRAVADVLALGWLNVHGIDPRAGRVTLAGTRLCPELEHAARHLCRQVKGICIDVPGEEGELFAAELQRTCGMPVTPRGAPADLTVEFGPVGTEGQLRLWGDLFLDGLRLTAEGVELPDELFLPMLTLLWEQGRVRRGQLRVCVDEKEK